MIVLRDLTSCSLAANPSVDCNTAPFTFILGQWKGGSVVCPTACGMSATVLQVIERLKVTSNGLGEYDLYVGIWCGAGSLK